MAKKDKGRMTAEPVSNQIPDPADGVRMETFIPWTLVKHRMRREVITPLDAPEVFREEGDRERRERETETDSAMVRSLGLAHYWQWLLDEGKYRPLTEVAAAEGMDAGQASRIAQLAPLAPEIVEVYASEKYKTSLLETLFRQSLRANWGYKSGIPFA